MTENMKLNGKEILFISSGFYQYDDTIIDNLSKMGAVVTYFCSAPTKNHTLMRVYQRLTILRNRYCNKIYAEIIKKEYDYIFILNSARLTDNFVSELCAHYKNACKILYCWDSVKTIPEVLGRIRLFDRVFSFASEDAQTIKDISLLPLFYSKRGGKSTEIKYDFSFVGFGHSKRYSFIKFIKEYADAHGYSYCFKLYLPSILYFIRGKFINKTFPDAKKNDFIYKSLNSKTVNQIIFQSRIIVDYEIGTQTGLTMRTIETLGMKKKLITTNKNVKNYDFYNPNNILIVDKENPLIDNEFVKSDYTEIPEHIYNQYSIDEWLKYMFFYEGEQ